MNSKKEMLSRLSGVGKTAPLQEVGVQETAAVTTTSRPDEEKKKVKAARKSKNVLIPEDLWDAYEYLKSSNTTSLLMTPYIIEAFREKLAKDGAFNKK